MTASPILAEFDVTELTETQQRAIRRGSRGRVEARSSTLRVLRSHTRTEKNRRRKLAIARAQAKNRQDAARAREERRRGRD